MIALTDHFKDRYVERIIGIENQCEVKQYVVQNEKIIEENANKMFSHSQFIYNGQIGKDKISRHFYVVDDIVIVATTEDDCLITLYRIDFNFPKETNKKVIKDLINEIQELEQYKKEQIEKTQFNIQNLQEECNRINTEIKYLEEQLQIFKDSKQLLFDEIQNNNNSITLINNKIDRYAHQLLYWSDYKKDLLKIS